MHIASPKLVACLPCCQHVAVYAPSPDVINHFDKLVSGRMEPFHSVHRDGVPVTSPCPGRWLVWWVWRNIMYRLLQEWHPPGIQLTSYSKVTFQSSSFFFCLLPVARSSHHLAASCQFSCSAASSLWCTSSNLMLFSRGAGEVLDLSPDIEDLSCAGPICDLVSIFFSVTFICILFHLQIFWFFCLFLHLKGLFFSSNMLKVVCFGEGDPHFLHLYCGTLGR